MMLTTSAVIEFAYCVAFCDDTNLQIHGISVNRACLIECSLLNCEVRIL